MERNCRILLVEDEPLIRVALADALESAGYSIIECDTGEKALGHLKLVGFAAIVTDIRLGAGLNGWDVARSARQQHPCIAVVYMTGDSAADWASEGVPTSILVQKPFAAAKMIVAVSSLLLQSVSL